MTDIVKLKALRRRMHQLGLQPGDYCMSAGGTVGKLTILEVPHPDVFLDYKGTLLGPYDPYYLVRMK